ncbi:Putative DNA-binding domain-containing protein [Ectothiorhodospira mobilis]|uniref:Putative DNA-binding domain-containing protein n=1 Tax=Ectothiorhodospira mobilis TaxID=195064 RepID=A0A1I4SW29_ECTMO|nr:DNA-binding domain-containing protein [Ectothiorhodospira mobilis]SFM68706.1 Putative DNA-binding domain-containing protein [Ectothiorhodospira mobilis]
MPSQTEFQTRFAHALHHGGPLPAGLAAGPPQAAGSRFDIHRNNLYAGLVDTLAAAYPVVQRLVGEAFFRAMARAFVARHLPQTPVLLHYGGAFPDFIAAFPPAAGLPYLADVARIERAWLQAWHAADAVPLDPARWAGTDPREAPHLRFALHPSLQVLESPWAARDIWQTHRHDRAPRPLEARGPQTTLICRPRETVQVRPAPAGTCPLVRALACGSTLEDAMAHATRVYPDLDLAACLGVLLRAGAITDLSPTGRPS